MKKLVILLFILAVIGCTKEKENYDGNSQPRGLIYFLEDIVFENNTLSFSFLIQYGSPYDKPVTIAYSILAEGREIKKGEASAKNELSGFGLNGAWGTDLISVPLDSATYSGQTITVFLDPEAKHTGKDYQSEIMTDAYRKESIIIP
ncbi:MAG: hypothetical protein ACOC2F_08770 [Bacteroidota bacterium]